MTLGGDQQEQQLSIAQQFAGRGVLLTGATGYVGRLVMEQLLRCCPDISAVFVLVRPGKHAATSSSSSSSTSTTTTSSSHTRSLNSKVAGISSGAVVGSTQDSFESSSLASPAARARVVRLLASPGLFSQVAAGQLRKVHVVEGDLLREGLGLSRRALQVLAQHADVLIHAAGHVELGAGVQEVLRSNYCCVEQLLQLADRQLPRLQAFTHVSSVWAYADQPTGATVKEEVKGLSLPSGQPLDHADLVHELLGLPRRQADLRAQQLLRHWGFPDAYCLSKRLVELLLLQHSQRQKGQKEEQGQQQGQQQQQQEQEKGQENGQDQLRYGLAMALVRPSIIGAVAGQPYPGYCLGNQNGATGLLAAFQSGFFTPGSLAWRGSSLLDIVPGDMAAANVLLATAALLKHAAGPSQAAAAAAAPGTQTSKAAAVEAPAGAEETAGPGAGELLPLSGSGSSRSSGAQVAGPGTAGGLLVIQAATSSSHPLRVWQLVQAMHGFTTGNPSRLRLAAAGHPWLGPSYRPSRPRVTLERALTAVKVSITYLFLLAIGQVRLAAKLRSGFADWLHLNSPGYDFDLRFDGARASELAAAVAPEEQSRMVLTWQAGQHDWLRYLMTMAAAAQSLALKQRALIRGVQHDFQLLDPAWSEEDLVLGSNCDSW